MGSILISVNNSLILKPHLGWVVSLSCILVSQNSNVRITDLSVLICRKVVIPKLFHLLVLAKHRSRLVPFVNCSQSLLYLNGLHILYHSLNSVVVLNRVQIVILVLLIYLLLVVVQSCIIKSPLLTDSLHILNSSSI